MPDISAYTKESRIILNTYEAAAKLKASEPRRRYLGMSQIGKECERALWLEFNGAPKSPIEGRVARVFANGHSTEDRLVVDLTAAGYQVTERQREFSDFKGTFCGHWDGRIEGPELSIPHVLETKSANDASFKAFKTKGVAVASPTYEGQLQCYMGYSGLLRALFVVENKNNQEIYLERVRFNTYRFIELKAKALRIISAKTMPEKAFEDNAPQCRFCNVRLACQSGAAFEIQFQPKGCHGCAWFRSQKDSGPKIMAIINRIKSIISFFRTKEQNKNKPANDYVGKKDIEADIAEFMDMRPDIDLPLELIHQKENDVEKFFLNLLAFYADFALVMPAGARDMDSPIVVTPLTVDLMTSEISQDLAPGDWCACANHRRRIYKAVGCSDLKAVI